MAGIKILTHPRGDGTAFRDLESGARLLGPQTSSTTHLRGDCGQCLDVCAPVSSSIKWDITSMYLVVIAKELHQLISI